MSEFEYSTGGATSSAITPEVSQQQQIAYIQNLLLAHEETGCHDAREVHVLYPASQRVRRSEPERLVNFYEPERLFLEQGQRQWINGEQATGWIIEDAVKIRRSHPKYYDMYYILKSILLLSDASYVVAGGPRRWAEQERENRLLVPGEYLQPLSPTDRTLDLLLIANSLWRLLPAGARRDGRWEA